MTTCLFQDATTCLHRRATTCLPASFRREAGGGLPRFLFCQRLTYTAGSDGAPDTTGSLLEHVDMLHECITLVPQRFTMMQRKGNKPSWCPRRRTRIHTQQTLSSQREQTDEQPRKARALRKHVRKPNAPSLMLWLKLGTDKTSKKRSLLKRRTRKPSGKRCRPNGASSRR